MPPLQMRYSVIRATIDTPLIYICHYAMLIDAVDISCCRYHSALLARYAMLLRYFSRYYAAIAACC